MTRIHYMRPWQRGLVVVVLLGIAFGLTVHHAATYDENWPHPTGDQLAEEPDGWDGEAVVLIEEVEAVSDDAVVVEVEDSDDELVTVVTAYGVDAEVEEGGTVQLYGELDDEASLMAVEETVVVNEDPFDQIYKLAMSVLGLVLAAGLFLYYWRIDWRRLRFVEREGWFDG